MVWACAKVKPCLFRDISFGHFQAFFVPPKCFPCTNINITLSSIIDLYSPIFFEATILKTGVITLDDVEATGLWSYWQKNAPGSNISSLLLSICYHSANLNSSSYSNWFYYLHEMKDVNKMFNRGQLTWIIEESKTALRKCYSSLCLCSWTLCCLKVLFGSASNKKDAMMDV